MLGKKNRTDEKKSRNGRDGTPSSPARRKMGPVSRLLSSTIRAGEFQNCELPPSTNNENNRGERDKTERHVKEETRASKRKKLVKHSHRKRET